MVAPWNETTLPTLLSKYDLKDIFSVHEFVLFYQCLPNKTYHFKGQKCSGGKNRKVRFTGTAVGNASGEKLPMFAIGKSKTPRCFKHIKIYPVNTNHKRRVGWTVKYLKNGCAKLDRTFQMEGRKTAHPSVSNLTNVQLVFLPPNTTSVLQPMNQGVIRSLKAHYCGRVVRRLCRTLDKKKTLPKLSILQGMKILVFSWGAVSAQTIVNCFRKAGITPEAQNPAIRDAGDPFSDLKESLQQLHDIDPDMVQEQSDEDDDNNEEVEEAAPEQPLRF